MSGSQVRRLREDEVVDAGQVAARAFQCDPWGLHVLPDPDRRAVVLRSLMTGVMRYGHLFGECYTTEDSPLGAAVWLPPPGRGTITFPRMREAGILSAVPLFGMGALARLVLLGTYVDLLDLQVYRTPHWYLWLLGVEPECQGLGIGGALLRPILARADEERLPCYLETMTERNVRFYEKHGFRVHRSGRPPFNGPRIWMMRRDPVA